MHEPPEERLENRHALLSERPSGLRYTPYPDRGLATVLYCHHCPLFFRIGDQMGCIVHLLDAHRSALDSIQLASYIKWIASHMEAAEVRGERIAIPMSPVHLRASPHVPWQAPAWNQAQYPLRRIAYRGSEGLGHGPRTQHSIKGVANSHDGQHRARAHPSTLASPSPTPSLSYEGKEACGKLQATLNNAVSQAGIQRRPSVADLAALRVGLQRDMSTPLRSTTSFAPSRGKEIQAIPDAFLRKTSRVALDVPDKAGEATQVSRPKSAIVFGRSKASSPAASSSASTDSRPGTPVLSYLLPRDSALNSAYSRKTGPPSSEWLSMLAASLPTLTPLQLADRFQEIFPDWLALQPR